MASEEKLMAKKPPLSFVGVANAEPERRTISDDIFDSIHTEIIAMRLTPGTKLSEVEIARQFDVSRQPVREAFFRLSNLNLLKVRPQRATVVCKISRKEISDARFIRAAVEVELARLACEKFGPDHEADFINNLQDQKQAVDANDFDSFHALDGQFHQLFGKIADREGAYRIIAEYKTPVDRLCALSLSRRNEFENVYLDHVKMFDLLKEADQDGLITLLREHFSRLDATIAEVSKSHAAYFEA